MKTPVINGLSLDQFVTPDTERGFFNNSIPANKYVVVNGFYPYDFPVDGLKVYIPFWHPSLQHSTFKSVDPYGRTCTATGVTWDSQAAVFDGVDDEITATDANLPAADSSRTIAMWIKNLEPAGATGNGYLFRYGKAANEQWQAAYVLNGASDLYYAGRSADFDTGINLNDSNWHFLEFKYDGTNASAFIDTVEGSGSPSAQASWNTVLDAKFALAANYGTEFAKIEIGEFWIWDSKLSADGDTYVYNNTKWRYQ